MHMIFSIYLQINDILFTFPVSLCHLYKLYINFTVVVSILHSLCLDLSKYTLFFHCFISDLHFGTCVPFPKYIIYKAPFLVVCSITFLFLFVCCMFSSFILAPKLPVKISLDMQLEVGFCFPSAHWYYLPYHSIHCLRIAANQIHSDLLCTGGFNFFFFPHHGDSEVLLRLRFILHLLCLPFLKLLDY